MDAATALAAPAALRPDASSQELFDAITVAAYVHGGGLILHANAPMLRLAGRDLESMRTLPHDALAAEDGRAALRAYGEACLAQPLEPPAMELQLRNAQGGVRPVEINARRIHIDGRPCVLVTCQDLSDIQHVQSSLLNLSQMLSQIINGGPLATFVIDREQRVTHWNRACEQLTGLESYDMQGSTETWRGFYPEARPLLADLIVTAVPHERLLDLFGQQIHRADLVDGAYEGEAFVPGLGQAGRWLHFNAAPIRGAMGEVIGAVQTMQDVTERREAEEELLRHRNQLEHLVEERSAELRATVEQLHSKLAELRETNQKLEDAQHQLLQQDKMASIGQLAAGVAHEINNPIGFVSSNLHTLKAYSGDMLRLIDAYQAAAATPADAERGAAVASLRRGMDIDYLREDVPQLLRESEDGLTRVKRIVQDLKDFSRVDQSEWQEADLNAGIESTLNVVMNEVKYKAAIVRELRPLPRVRCLAAQLNQVFMNLIVNASQAMTKIGTITLGSGVVGDWVWIEVADTGCGMSEDVIKRVFEPFYTTKPVGKGTGLGLSLSFSIVQRHGGVIRVRSTPGAGSAFKVWVPVAGPAPEGVAQPLPPADD